jgi:flagellar hook protein FlgE
MQSKYKKSEVILIMMRSLYSAISGLRNHQTRMDVIGNNIANVNTTGFKQSRVTFQDTLSQTLQGASSAAGNQGGSNPMQVGMGMAIASIDTIFTDGSFSPTGKSTDLGISGNGFFVISNGQSQMYTRNGAFDFDTSGNFVMPGSGYKVVGWKADANGNIDTTQPTNNIQIPVGATMPAKASTQITYGGNLLGDAIAGATSQSTASIEVYDSQGNAYKVSGTFEKAATPINTWKFTPAATVTNSDGVLVGNVTGGASTITFNADGTYNSVTTAPLVITPPAASPYAGAGPTTVNLNFAGMTQYGGGGSKTATSNVTVDRDGYTAGTLESKTVSKTGVISGRFSNGQSQDLAQVALASFNNPGGLEKVGESLYVKSNNSGEPQVGTSGTGGRGSFSPGTLEMSNVDLATEFSNMIVTQRGFQANSKVITTTDTMLEELVNLKR